MEAVRGGLESEAARKVLNAREILGPAERKFRLRFWGVVIALPAALLALLVTLSIIIPRSPALSIFASLSIGAVVMITSIAAIVGRPGALRPRENWLGLGWRFLEWNKADVRNLLIAALIFVAGLVIGSR